MEDTTDRPTFDPTPDPADADQKDCPAWRVEQSLGGELLMAWTAWHYFCAGGPGRGGPGEAEVIAALWGLSCTLPDIDAALRRHHAGRRLDDWHRQTRTACFAFAGEHFPSAHLAALGVMQSLLRRVREAVHGAGGDPASLLDPERPSSARGPADSDALDGAVRQLRQYHRAIAERLQEPGYLEDPSPRMLGIDVSVLRAEMAIERPAAAALLKAAAGGEAPGPQPDGPVGEAHYRWRGDRRKLGPKAVLLMDALWDAAEGRPRGVVAVEGLLGKVYNGANKRRHLHSLVSDLNLRFENLDWPLVVSYRDEGYLIEITRP